MLALRFQSVPPFHTLVVARHFPFEDWDEAATLPTMPSAVLYLPSAMDQKQRLGSSLAKLMLLSAALVFLQLFQPAAHHGVGRIEFQ